MYSVHKYKTAVRNTAVPDCRKSLFFQKSACSQSLTPNPFPVGRGYIAGATAPSPCRGLCPCDPIFNKQEVYRQTKTAVRNTAVHSLFDCFRLLDNSYRNHSFSCSYLIGYAVCIALNVKNRISIVLL